MADGLEFSVVVQSKSFSCSGIVLDVNSGTVLTVGSITNSLVAKAGNELEKQHAFGAIQPQANTNETVQVILKRVFKEGGERKLYKDDFISLDGSVIAIWRDQTLYKLQKKFFPEAEWTFEHEKVGGNKKSENERENNAMKHHNSSFSFADFALIIVKDLPKYLSSKLPALNVLKPLVGDPVTVVGTPFGSECYSVFFNSMSKGIVSSVIGPTNELILIDARCVPGSEGCPVFAESSHTNLSIYGVVVAPLCWRSGEWIGLALVCSLVHILKNMLDSNILPKTHPSRKPLTQFLSPLVPIGTELSQHSLRKLQSKIFLNDRIQNAKKSIVLIQCGSTWGSGIVMDADKGLVITCRHILTEGGVLNTSTNSYIHNCERSIIPLSIHDIPSQTVYRTVDIVFATALECSLDFAVLRVQTHDFKSQLKLDHQDLISSKLLSKGSDVLALGYSVFGSDTSTEPCLTSGIISNISHVNGIPAMLQTTAAVHGGGSGGAIISRYSGQLLGMVTCNIKDANTSSSFPHINFSIPINLIHKLMSLAMSGGGVSSKDLSLLMSGIDQVWCLNASQPVKSKL